MLRRSFLGGLLGTPMALAANPKEMAKVLGVQDATTASAVAQTVEENFTLPEPIASDSWLASPVGKLRQYYYRYMQPRIEAERTPIKYMSPHIRDKKSWSPAFKAMVHARERTVELEFDRMLNNQDNSFATRILKQWGIK